MKSTKKIFSLILVVAMLLSLSISAFAVDGQPGDLTISLSADKTTLSIGEKVYVTVSIDQAVNKFMSMQADVNFDKTKLKYLGGTLGAAGSACYMDITEHTTTYSRIFLTSIIGLVMPFDVNVPAGELCTLEFEAIANGEIDFNFSADAIRGVMFYTQDGLVLDEDGDGNLFQLGRIGVNEGPDLKVIVADPPALTADYQVRLAGGGNVIPGETATVDLFVDSVSQSDFTTLNVILEFDTNYVTYDGPSFAAAGIVVQTLAPNKLSIWSFGAVKSLGKVLTLEFTGATMGTDSITITSAQAGNNSTIIDGDTPVADIVTPSVDVKVTGYPVTLVGDLTGASVAYPTADYTFLANDTTNFDYTITMTVGGVDTTSAIVDNGDGTYTIDKSNITGPIVITAVKTAKTYSVTFTGAGAVDVSGNAPTAPYGTDYTFTLTEEAGYNYTVAMTIGGTTYTAFTKAGDVYTIPGTAINGNIAVNITKLSTDVTVTVVGNAAADVTAAPTAAKNTDFVFTVAEEAGFTYSVTATVGGAPVTLSTSGTGTVTYTIAGVDVIDDIVITANKTMAATVNVYEYVKFNSGAMFLVTVDGVPGAGRVYAYDDVEMFWSDKYNAYAYLVIESDAFTAADAAAEVSIVTGTHAGTIDYSGDVNGTGVIDFNDAQLVYAMYNAEYENFTAVSMIKFLRADLNGDHVLDTGDTTALVSIIFP